MTRWDSRREARDHEAEDRAKREAVADLLRLSAERYRDACEAVDIAVVEEDEAGDRIALAFCRGREEATLDALRAAHCYARAYPGIVKLWAFDVRNYRKEGTE